MSFWILVIIIAAFGVGYVYHRGECSVVLEGMNRVLEFL